MSSFEPLCLAADAGIDFAPLIGGAGSAAGQRRESIFPDVREGGEGRSAGAESPAQREATRRREQEQREAYERGVAAGLAQAEERVHADLVALGEAITEVARFRSTLLERYHGELLELSLEVARKVVKRELTAHPEHWIGMIRDGVQKAVDRERIRVRVGHLLHGFLHDHLAELRAQLEEVKDLELLEDLALPATGCVIETSFGDVDLGIDSQLAAIGAALLDPT